jgi:hypothetical protein
MRILQPHRMRRGQRARLQCNTRVRATRRRKAESLFCVVVEERNQQWQHYYIAQGKQNIVATLDCYVILGVLPQLRDVL